VKTVYTALPVAVICLLGALLAIAEPSFRNVLIDFHRGDESQFKINAVAGQYGAQQHVYLYEGGVAFSCTSNDAGRIVYRQAGHTNDTVLSLSVTGTHLVGSFTNGMLATPTTMSVARFDLLDSGTNNAKRVSAFGVISITR